MDIQKVFEAYEADLAEVESRLLGMFQSEVLLIPAIGRHLIQSGGKRMRPLFLLLSAYLCGYRGRDHITLAGIIESIHTASLLHDDVVDSAHFRRGKPSANSLWGNQAVILVGDFLYSNALRLTTNMHNHSINEALSTATTMMTQGELMQLQYARNVDITEAQYFAIVSAKTGALISAASRSGAILSGASEQKEEALGRFGLKAGNAFQIADDVLDYYADERELGKKLGKDLEEGKVTLPLICLLRKVTAAEKQEIDAIISSEKISEDGLRRIMALFKKYNATEEAMLRARALVQEAKDELKVFAPCTERDYLCQMADYALTRGK